MTHIAYKIIDDARAELMEWSSEKMLPVHKLDFVAVFEDWNDHLGVWVFYDTDKDLKACNENGTCSEIEEKYLELLTKYQYPFTEFPKVGFTFDSHENVENNYEGSYFYRLR